MFTLGLSLILALNIASRSQRLQFCERLDNTPGLSFNPGNNLNVIWILKNKGRNLDEFKITMECTNSVQNFDIPVQNHRNGSFELNWKIPFGIIPSDRNEISCSLIKVFKVSKAGVKELDIPNSNQLKIDLQENECKILILNPPSTITSKLFIVGSIIALTLLAIKNRNDEPLQFYAP